MSKTYLRIDDRLIHGQITTSWIQYLNIQRIVVVDDKTASNNMIKSIVAMAAPPKMMTKILKVEEAYAAIKENVDKELNQLVILKYPELISKICFKELNIEKVIIGTVAKKDTTVKQLSPNIFLTQKDIDALNWVKQQGYDIEIRMLPSTAAIKF